MPITKSAKTNAICTEGPFTTFNGTEFYQKYSRSVFLGSSKGKKFILRVLSSAIQIKHQLQDETSVTLKGIKLDDKEDLIIKKGSVNETIGDFDFTLKRLQGFCAAYACAHVERFDHNTIVAIAASLGYELTPDSTEDFRKFYFSFAPGAEHFSYILEFWPLVSTLVQMTLMKDTLKIKKTIRKFRVKGDDKMKLMYHLKDKNVLPRVINVVAQKIEGEKIDFGDCLRAFRYSKII